MDKIEEEPCIQESDKEEEKNEREPIIIEVCSPSLNNPEDSGSSANNKTESDESESDTKANLEIRVQNLKDLMVDLKETIKEEKELLRKEFDEMNKLQMQMVEFSPDILVDLKPELEKSAICLDLDYDPTMKSSFLCLDNRDSSLIDPTILEYEKKLSRYQEALAAAQAEKRQNLRRQIAANTYKKKLMEVEQLCNAELARVRQSASFLEPLNKIVSEWKLSSKDSYQIRDQFSCLQEHSRSLTRNFSLTHDIHVNKMSADLDVSLTQEHHASSSKLATGLNLNHEEITGPDHFSVKMNANLNVAEVQQTPVWRGDGFQEPFPIWTTLENSLPKHRLSYIYTNNHVM